MLEKVITYHVSGSGVVHVSRNGPAPCRAPLHRTVLITRPTLTGHGPVQGGIEVGGAIWPCISGCNGFGYKVRLFPAGLSVDFS